MAKTKKIITILIIVFLLAIIGFLVMDKFGLFDDGLFNNDDQQFSEPVQLKTKDINKQRYVTTPNKDADEMYTSFSDGIYNYYVFYLGHVNYTPITFISTDYYNGLTALNLEFTDQTSKKEQVSSSTSTCISQAVTTSTTGTVSTSLKAKFPAGPVSLEATASLGLSKTKTKTSTNSTTNTYTSSNEYISSHQRRAAYIVSDPCPVGYYRYALCATCDIYAVAFYEIETGEKGYDFINCARENTYAYIIDYSEDGDFEKNSDTSKLKFDWAWLDGVDFNTPITEKVNPQTEAYFSGLPQNVTVLYDTEKKRIKASGTILQADEKTDWGLAHNNPDRLDLVKYHDYMSEDYEWFFTIEIEMKKIDKGYQEVYLYNEFVAKKDDTYSKDTAKSNGLLFYDQAITISGSTDTFNKTWIVSGANCRSEMYIRYGAHGKNSDDWDRLSIKVSLTIEKKEHD